MNKYGCCAQGLVSPKEVIPQLLELSHIQQVCFADTLIEDIADSTGFGRKRSNGQDHDTDLKWHMSIAERIRAFEVENTALRQHKSIGHTLKQSSGRLTALLALRSGTYLEVRDTTLHVETRGIRSRARPDYCSQFHTCIEMAEFMG